MDTLDPRAALLPVVSGYAPARLLGRGASSSVWLAKNDKDGSRVAIKIMEDASQSAVEPRRRRVEVQAFREAEILSAVRHEHLLAFQELVSVGNDGTDATPRWGLVMDYAAGGSLANLVSVRGRLSVGEAVTVLTPVAQVLAFLHGKGIVHGDIAPGNVLFTAHGKPLVSDLGLAGLLGEMQIPAGTGTPGFMDKAEQAQLLPVQGIEPTRDVYSLAALGWFCLTGSAPEPARSRPPLSLLVPEVPKGLVAALEAGLDPDRQLRPSAKELGTAIFRSAAPEPVDLVGAVHESVVPELLTQRPGMSRPRGRGFRARLDRVRRPARGVRRKQPGQSSPDKRLRERGQPRSTDSATGIRFAATVCLAGLLAGAFAWVSWTEGADPSSGGSRAESEPALSQQAATVEEHSDVPPGVGERLGSDDPVVAVSALSAVRDLALAQGLPGLLVRVNAPGSPAALADEELSKQLASQGIRLSGLTTSVTAVTLNSREGGHALVSLTAATSSYEELDVGGKVLRWQPPGEPQLLRLVLARFEGHWLISEILAPE